VTPKKKKTKITSDGHGNGCGETGTPVHCYIECKMVQPPLWKSMIFPQKIENRFINPTSGE
jgi:hypothetical protein